MDYNEYQFLKTVEENKQDYTQAMIDWAEHARKLYGIIQYPSIPDYKNMVRYEMIKNWPVTIEDIETMVKIYRPDFVMLFK